MIMDVALIGHHGNSKYNSSASLFLPVDTTNMLHMIQFLSTFIYKSNHNQYYCKASRKPSSNCHVIEYNLYRVFLSICDDKRITDRVAQQEEKKVSSSYWIR